MSKVIMLDIDGVLATRRSHLAYGKEGSIWFEWDPLACAVLRRCCTGYTDGYVAYVKIVVSSTWRKSMHEHDLRGKLNKYGLLEFLHEDWRTKELNGTRGGEIAEWLSRHHEVTDYRIVDDDNDMLESQLPKCIFTDSEDGMTSDNIKKLLNWSGAWKA